MGTSPQARSRLLVAALMAVGSGALAGCNRGVLDPQGPIASAEKTILMNSLAIMLAIVVPTIIATLAVAFWFRASNSRARHRPDWTFSGEIELVVWAVPSMVVLLLSGIAWIGSHELEPSKPLQSKYPPVVVEVVSLDWKWLFIYPQLNIASVNQLTIPVGIPIAFRLTSASVMNSFFVPQLGSQIYTMAGMATQLHLQADKPGTYKGISAQYSGAGFSDMRFTVEAVTSEAFNQWVSATRAQTQSLDQATYAALAQRSRAVAPMSYGGVTEGLFNSIVGMSGHSMSGHTVSPNVPPTLHHGTVPTAQPDTGQEAGHVR
jgi:cytochrome o ubiquinol oxidase subunit II